MNEIQGRLDGAGRRFAIVVSRYNELVTERLLEGALACLREHGVADDDVDVVRVPGAWELPQAARCIADAGRHAAIVAIGCVIRGETAHFEYVAGSATRGLTDVALDGRIPVGLGVLTTDTLEQALARAGGAGGNKGWEAALSALEMVDLFTRLEGGGAGA